LQKISTRRPFELSAGEQVNMQMGHALARIAPMVDHETEAFVA
jgi:hypothetical protein